MLLLYYFSSISKFFSSHFFALRVTFVIKTYGIREDNDFLALQSSVKDKERDARMALFCYLFVGWEGSAADSYLFEKARETTFAVPKGCYYLADAGFPSCDVLLVPYRGVRYHLREWGAANQR